MQVQTVAMAESSGRRWSWLFLLIAILTGPALVLRIPPGHAPDERNHILRADSLLHGQVIGHREFQNGRLVEGVVADEALSTVITLPPAPSNITQQPISPLQKWLATQVPWDEHASFIEAGSIAGYMPLFYVPGACAIALSRAAGLSPYVAFLAVRSLNLYCFLILGAVALRVARRGTALIFAILLLPMTLSLAASCSQDGLLIASTACAVACLTRTLSPDGRTHTRWLVAAACLLALVAAGKPPYAPLALLLFLPSRSSKAHLARRAGLVVLTILPALAWAFFEARLANVTMLRTPEEAGPLWPGPRPAVFSGPDPLAQLDVLLHHKEMIFLLPLQVIFHDAGIFLQQGVGVLDYLCLYLPGWLYLTWYTGLACALAAHICAAPSSARLTLPDFLLSSTAIFLSVVLFSLALYLDWTPVGMPWIGGIQGRYFLPLLMALPLCLPRLDRPRVAYALSAPPILAALISAATLPRLVSAFYPLR